MVAPAYPTKQWRREYIQATREWPEWLSSIEMVWNVIDHEGAATPLEFAGNVWKVAYPYGSAHWWLANVRQYGPGWVAPEARDTLNNQPPLPIADA